MPDNDPVQTVSDLLRQAAHALAGQSETARLDAEILLGHVLDTTRASLYIQDANPVDADSSDRFLRLIEQRKRGRPVAQLTGTREFWSLPIRVTTNTLVPRPETELLVERTLRHLPDHKPCTVLDLGTGSGAVALAIAKEHPEAKIVATDISAAALDVARVNGKLAGPGRIDWRNGDWFGALESDRFDVIVSNPPYVGTEERRFTDPELAHEPELALYSGPDGLESIRRIVAGARAHLKPGGWLLLEHGFQQQTAVQTLFGQHGFDAIATYPDLAGQPRVTEGRRAVGGDDRLQKTEADA